MENSVNLIVKPTILQTTPELRDYPVTTRQCYFSFERRLKYFAQYSLTNCEIECEAAAALNNCSCVPINFPSNASCGPAQQACIITTIEALNNENMPGCNCLPACSSISFDAEVSVADLNMSTLFGGQQFDKE